MKIKELPGYGKFKKLCDFSRCEKYYPGWTGEEKYLIITDAPEEQLQAEFPGIMKELSPYVIVGKYFQQMNEAERYSGSKYQKMTVSLDQLTEQGPEWVQADAFQMTDPAVSIEEQKLLTLALGCLTETQRSRVIRYYLEGETHEEIAMQDGKSRASVCGSLRRSLEKMRKYMEKTNDPE